MAATSMRFDVPPERAFEVLSQPRSYAFWVTGARSVEDHDPNWPAPGSSFRHTQGVAPLVITDTTSVVSADPPRRLELEARVRPFLVVRIVLELEPNGAGTSVTIDEWPVGGLLELPLKIPPGPQLIQLRNKEALRRLRRLAES
jgi:uncharacterized protein YndB with AHSA1/START domain